MWKKFGEITKLKMAAVGRNVPQAKITALWVMAVPHVIPLPGQDQKECFFSLISGITRMPGQDQLEYFFFLICGSTRMQCVVGRLKKKDKSNN